LNSNSILALYPPQAKHNIVQPESPRCGATSGTIIGKLFDSNGTTLLQA
jgi:hypothetical protein